MSRVDLFTPIHKALRARTYECASQLQCADLADEAEARRTLDSVDRTIAMLVSHRDSEESFVFPALESREPALVDRLRREHTGIERLRDDVLDAVAATRNADRPGRVEAGDELNRRFNKLVATYLAHFAEEDTELLPASRRHLTDEELVAIRERIQGSIAPEDNADALSWIFRSQNRAELAGLLAGAKAAAPPPVFERMAMLAQASVTPERWATVCRQIGLPQERAA